MTKEPFFLTSPRVLTCLLTLSFRTTPTGVFMDYFSFRQFSVTSTSVWKKKKLKSLHFATLKFQIQEAKILLCKLTSVLLRSKPTQQNCLQFFKNFKKQCAW